MAVINEDISKRAVGCTCTAPTTAVPISDTTGPDNFHSECWARYECAGDRQGYCAGARTQSPPSPSLLAHTTSLDRCYRSNKLYQSKSRAFISETRHLNLPLINSADVCLQVGKVSLRSISRDRVRTHGMRDRLRLALRVQIHLAHRQRLAHFFHAANADDVLAG